jgi:hypothetical protein
LATAYLTRVLGSKLKGIFFQSLAFPSITIGVVKKGTGLALTTTLEEEQEILHKRMIINDKYPI